MLGTAGVLLFIAVYLGAAGPAGAILTDALRGLFGAGAFAMPLALLAMSAGGLMKREARIPYRNILLLFWTALALLHLFFQHEFGHIGFGETFGAIFDVDRASAVGGGIFGFVPAALMSALLGRTGAVIAFFAALLVIAMLTSGRSPFWLLERALGVARDFFAPAAKEKPRTAKRAPASRANREAENAKKSGTYKTYETYEAHGPRGARETEIETEEIEEIENETEIEEAEIETGPVAAAPGRARRAPGNPPKKKRAAGKKAAARRAPHQDSIPLRRKPQLFEIQGLDEARPGEKILLVKEEIAERRKERLADWPAGECGDGYDEYGGYYDGDGCHDAEATYALSAAEDAGFQGRAPYYADEDDNWNAHASATDYVDEDYADYWEGCAESDEAGDTKIFSRMTKKPPAPAESFATESEFFSDPEIGIEIETEMDGCDESRWDYGMPPIDLLAENSALYESQEEAREKVYENSKILARTLKSFKIDAKVTEVSVGPAVTRYEVAPGLGVKVSSIVNLSSDIALSLAAEDIRIEAPVPGKSAVGIEIPNKEPRPVFLREVVETQLFQEFGPRLAFAVGRDLAGEPVVADIAEMPHLLIAGATGSGKSVCMNALIASILYKARPDEARFLMLDPKVVELSGYNGIPHLLRPVVTDPAEAVEALGWAVQEMDERYNMLADAGCRDLEGYNASVRGNGRLLARIVIIIDELADLMMAARGDAEERICRLAQKARAAGIHLVVATQRPSSEIITGLIKANIPSRLAFAVSSGGDSRTVLDMYGAEKLLGKGDMLFLPMGRNKPVRVQGCFVSDREVEALAGFLRAGA